jgi:hypothetical protein
MFLDNLSCPTRKLLIAIPFVYAAYIVLKCPCTFIGSCHLGHFVAAMLIGLALVVYENRSLVMKRPYEL